MCVARRLLVLSACLALVAGARADVILTLDSYQYLSGSGVWEYTYGIDNGTGTEYVYYVELDPVDGAHITGFPTGWGDTFEDSSIGGYVQWSATSSTDWIVPGASPVTGYVIESAYGPVTDYVHWAVYTDPDGSPGPPTNATDPAPIEGPHVAEPGTLVLLVMGGGGLLAWRRKVAGGH